MGSTRLAMDGETLGPDLAEHSRSRAGSDGVATQWRTEEVAVDECALPLVVGEVLGERFEPRERLGSGAFGVVDAAWDRLPDGEVAVKRLRVDRSRSHLSRTFARATSSSGSSAMPRVVVVLAQDLSRWQQGQPQSVSKPSADQSQER